MKAIHVRNVPDDVHEILRLRAAQRGISLSAYLRKEIEVIARRPTMEQVLTRAGRAGSVCRSEDSATAVRRIRDAG